MPRRLVEAHPVYKYDTARKKSEQAKARKTAGGLFATQSEEVRAARQRQGISSFFSGTQIPETMLGVGFDDQRRRRRKRTPGAVGAAPGATLLGGGYAA